MDAEKTGALIAAARKEKGMTQRIVAEHLHVSVQAVSKWEQGQNFPDITLLEPLGALLELTVAELMAGSRNAPPQEESLRSALQLGARQLKEQAKRWHRSLTAAATALLLLAGCGFLWEHTEVFPQRETVLTPLEVSKEDEWWVGPMTDGTLLLYDVRLADDVAGYCVQMERWTERGMEERWELSRAGGGTRGSWERRQKLGLQLCALRGDTSGTVESRVSFLLGTSFRPVEGISGLTHDRGLGMREVKETVTVDRDAGAILCWYIIPPENAGRWSGPSWFGETPEPEVKAGETYLVIRLLCDYE